MFVIFLIRAFLFYRCFPFLECIVVPTFLWPLNQNTSLYEVMQNITQKSLCTCYNETHDNNHHKTLSLCDDQPYIDLNVASESFVQASIALAFKPLGQANGTLFHYKHTGGGNDLIAFSVSFFHDGSNTVLRAKRWVDTSSVERDFISSSTIADDHWHFLVFVIKYSAVYFMIYLNSEIFDDSATFTYTNKHLNTPGVLRLGANLDTGNDVFKGSVTCLALFNDEVSGGDKTEILEFCSQTTSWNFVPPQTPLNICRTTKLSPEDSSRETTTGCSVNTTGTSNHFGYFKKDPSGMSPTQSPHSFISVTRGYSCASFCLISCDLCRSFTVTHTDKQGKTYCSLFSKAYNTGLSVFPNTTYYKRRENV